jgi:Flp pilus assembly protein TadG
MRRRRNDDRGAVAVEFGLVVLFGVFPLLLGLIQIVFMYQAKVTLNQAARTGARLASICRATCSPSVVSSTISAAPGLDTSGMTVTVQYCPAAGSCQGDGTYCPTGATQATGSAVVQISYVDRLTFVLLPAAAAPAVTLSGKASSPCGG